MKTQTKKVLIVEDDAMMAGFIQDAIASVKLECTHAKDGIEALFYLANDSHYDLMITDLRMPRMHGEQLVIEVRKIYKNIPVVVLSGYVKDDALRSELLEMGVKEILDKPIVFKDLVSSIQRNLKAQNPV